MASLIPCALRNAKERWTSSQLIIPTVSGPANIMVSLLFQRRLHRKPVARHATLPTSFARNRRYDPQIIALQLPQPGVPPGLPVRAIVCPAFGEDSEFYRIIDDRSFEELTASEGRTAGKAWLWDMCALCIPNHGTS